MIDDSIDVTLPFPMHHERPAWSRDGRIVYEDRGIVGPSLAPELAGLWVIDPADGSKYRLYPAGLTPAWSPDGQEVAFAAGGIHVLNIGTREVRRLTTTGYYPAWSPDGTRICYDGDANGELAIVTTNGQGTHDLATRGRMPSWNPAASVILHVRIVPGAEFVREIFQMSEDGRDAVRITASGGDKRRPTYSPNGDWIASSFLAPGEVLPQIWVWRADGRDGRRLTTEGGASPSWSPDAMEIVYTRQNWLHDLPSNGVLWIVNVTSLEQRQLTEKWVAVPP